MLVATAEKSPQTTNMVAAIDDVGKVISKDSSQSSQKEIKFSFNMLQREEPWCIRRAMKRQFLGRMQAGSKRPDLNGKDLLDISDTGGQPMFHEVLPLFIHNIMFGILIVKLNECLDSYPLVEYYTKGERVGEPIQLTFHSLRDITPLYEGNTINM